MLETLLASETRRWTTEFICRPYYFRVQMAIDNSEFKRVLREEAGAPSDLTEEGREVAHELVVLPD
jgi:hypothetical protein